MPSRMSLILGIQMQELEKVVYFAGYIVTSVDEAKKKDTNYKSIDEFDIAILTKNGKFIIFECKSSGMHKDEAKSTNYSTYAISGVYGKPILITPLIGNEIKDIDALNKSIYDKIQKSVGKAKRATLDVWGIDDIANNIEAYIK